MGRWISKGLLFSAFGMLVSCGGGYDIEEVKADIVVEKRDLLVDPQAEEFRPTAKLLFIVDNSSSMKDEQVLLANGIASTFEQLKGYNLDIHVLTTSSGNAAELAPKSAVRIDKFRDDGDGVFAPILTADPNPAVSNVSYRKKRSYSLKSATPDGEAIQLRRSMTAPEMDAVKDSLVSVISGIGTDGSDVESGYCTALRALIAQKGDDHFLVAGDRVAVVVISDDNDYSSVADCSAEETDFYKWVAPVGGTRAVAPNAQNTNYYSYATSWGPKDAYQLDISYTDSNNPQAFWNLSTVIAQTETITFDYTYRADVNNDGQISTVTQTVSNQSLAFDPAAAGNPALSTSAQTCTSALTYLALARAQAISPSGREHALTRCVYSYSAVTKSQNISAALAGMGTQTSTTACSATTTDDLLANKASYPGLFPAGKRFISCSHYYRAATSHSKQIFLSAPPSGVNYTSGILNCSANATLRDYAVTQLAELAAPGESPVYSSCTLRVRSATKNCNFDDAKLDTLPAGSTSADLPNQCVNADLKTYVASPRTSCTAAQLADLALYGCTRTAKTTATENYTAQAARYEFNAAASTKKSALAALEERVDIVPAAGLDEGTHLVSSVETAARKLFGQSGFFFSAIVKPADTSGCPGQIPGDGERYRRFATDLGTMGSTSSICANTYAPALDNISSFIVRVMNNSYMVKIKETEEIEDVSIQRGTQTLTLNKGVDYQTLGGSMTFTPDVLELGDKIQLRIKNTFKVKVKID